MNKQPPKFELDKYFVDDAACIIQARQRAQRIHHTRDIDTAGNEIEGEVRRVLCRKLPSRYYVGHGHIVDAELATSPQLDLIIADKQTTPILFKANDGTEYFPYEAVYAVGEIKSTYDKSKKYIHKFCENIDKIKNVLKRERTGQLSNVKTIGNPLFTFMLFVDAKDFRPDDLKDLYSSRQADELPNIICLLNSGVVAEAQIEITDKDEAFAKHINPHPGLYSMGGITRWGHFPLVSDEHRAGATYGMLYLLLLKHLNSCTLMPPDMLLYAENIGETFQYHDATFLGPE